MRSTLAVLLSSCLGGAAAAEFPPLNPTSVVDGHIVLGHGKWAISCVHNTGDFNGDGYADLWVNCRGNNYFLLNDQNNNFKARPGAMVDGYLRLGKGEWAHSCSLNTGDFNNDGYSDLWANCGGNNYFLLNDQNNNFRARPGAMVDGYLRLGKGKWAHSCSLNTGDFNGDGYSDLWANCGGNNYFLLNNKANGFASHTVSAVDGHLRLGNGKWAHSCTLNTGHFSHTAYSDLWANCGGNNYFLLNTRNQGVLGFDPITSATRDGYIPLGRGKFATSCKLRTGDFDNDGFDDLWANCNGNNYFLRRDTPTYHLKYVVVATSVKDNTENFQTTKLSNQHNGNIDNCAGSGTLEATKHMSLSQTETKTMSFTESFMSSFTSSFTSSVEVTSSFEVSAGIVSASASVSLSFSATKSWTKEQSTSNTREISDETTIDRGHTFTATAGPETCLAFEVNAEMSTAPLTFEAVTEMKLTVYPKEYVSNPSLPQVTDRAVLQRVMQSLPPSYRGKKINDDNTIGFETDATVQSVYVSTATIKALPCTCA